MRIENWQVATPDRAAIELRQHEQKQNTEASAYLKITAQFWDDEIMLDANGDQPFASFKIVGLAKELAYMMEMTRVRGDATLGNETIDALEQALTLLKKAAQIKPDPSLRISFDE